jgi:hypothetical protein
LVVIGILIALQVSNWSENKKTQNLIRSYAHSLISDIQNDIKEVSATKSQIEEYTIRIDSLANYVRKVETNELSNLILFPLIIGDNMYRPYSRNKTTMEDLKISGVLRFKGNEELSDKIVAYESFTEHLIEDYYVDLNLKDKASTLAGTIINLNYSNFDDISRFGNTNTHIFTYGFDTTEAYQIAKKEDLKLLTYNNKSISEMVNAILKLKTFLDIRKNSELPRFIQKANEIINHLNEIYL